MRNAFAKEMTALAENNPDLVLLTGDMGNRLFDTFKQNYPDRFCNCGVAEANMASVAAGMALSGLKPVTYSIAPFNTYRCLEQIKLDICYHQLPVVVVGVGAGLSYAELGPTHQSCEDISILRSLPDMTVVCPGDAVEVRLALRDAVVLGKPVYFRLGKKNEPVVHKEDPVVKIGKAIMMNKGTDLCLISTGNALPIAAETAALLSREGASVSLVSMHTVKPLDDDALTNIFKTHLIVASIEEHSLIGGLGTALEEWRSTFEVSQSAKLMKFGCEDRLLHLSFNQKNVRDQFGLNSEKISALLIDCLNGREI